jgi:hypothetical protein
MSSHISAIGLHAHKWRTVYTTEAVALQTCVHCGTRRAVAAGDPRFAPVPLLAPWQADWCAGGDLPETALPTVR